MSHKVSRIIKTLGGVALLGFAALTVSSSNAASNETQNNSADTQNNSAAVVSGVDNFLNVTDPNTAQVTAQNTAQNTVLAPAAANTQPLPSQANQTSTVSTFVNTSPVNTPKIGSGAHLLNVTLGLVLIVGIILAISWFAKRFSYGAFAANNHLKVIAAMPLGTRERILLIEAGGQPLLIGITPTQINTLHVFDEAIFTAAKNVAGDSIAPNSMQSEFGRKLMAILQGKTESANKELKSTAAPGGDDLPKGRA